MLSRRAGSAAYRKWARNGGRVAGLEQLEGRVLLSTTVAVTGSTADQGVYTNGTLKNVAETTVRVGDKGDATMEEAYVIPFLLPTGTNVVDASFSVYLESVFGPVTGGIDLYGLGFRALSPVQGTDFYEGPFGGDATDATAIQTNLLTATSTPGLYTTSAAGKTALVNWLNAQYANGAGAGAYVFLRLNPQNDQAVSKYWNLDTANNTTAGRQPVLSITYDTPTPPADTTAPTVSVATPGSNERLSGTGQTISGAAGTASGDSTAVTVKIYAGGAAAGNAAMTVNGTANAAGAFSVDAAGLPQGRYTVQVTQSDAAGNVGASSPVTYFTYNTLAGDANGDSVVNFSDFVTLSNNFGQATAAGPGAGDFDYSGVVDFADFVILSNSFGRSFTAAPSAVSVKTKGSANLGVSWADNSGNETGFVIERSTDGTNFTQAGTVGAGVTTFDDTNGLSADTTYYYRVKASNGNSDSAYSAVGSNATLPAFLHTIWVDGTAPAAGADGSYAHPWTTIATGLSKAVAGDGVVVRGGTYKGNVRISVSGTTGLPITLMGTPGERTILSGFDAVTGWTPLSGGIYQAMVTSIPTSLYVGMTQLKQARTPGSGWWVWQGVTQNGDGTVTISDSAHLAGLGNATGGTVQLHIGVGNLFKSYVILSHDTAAGTITIQGDASTPGLTPSDVYMIKNKLPLIAGPGEWASEDQGDGTYKVYYWAKDLSDLAQMQTRSATVTGLVTATSGMHDFVVSGFEVAGSKQYGIDLEKVNNVVVKNNIVHDNAAQGIWMRYDDNIEISNNLLTLNYTGLGISSINHAVIKNNEVGYNQNDGMDLTGDVSGKEPGDVGFTPSDDIWVMQNYVHHQSYVNHSDGIQLYRWLTNVHILDNVVINNEQGIMTEEVDDVAVPGTSEIRGNVIWGSAASLVIFGHNNSNNWTVANNTLGGGATGMFQMTGFNYDFTENVIVGLTNAAATYTGNRNLVWTTNANGQIFRDANQDSYTTIPAWNAFSGQDAQSVKADPLFNNVPLLKAEAEVVGSTASTLLLDDATGFSVGQHVEIARDGVLRTITGISGNLITLDVPLTGAPLFAMLVYNWGSRTNFEWDTRLSAGSPGLTMSSTGGRVGSQIVMSQYKAGDFNGDGKRDLPKLPSDVGMPPDLAWWAT